MPPPPSPSARTAFVVNAVVAWFGVLVTVLLSLLGWYREGAVERGLYGDTGDGLAGVLSRLTDTLSYFTTWSNVVVAVSVTLLVLRPAAVSLPRRVLHLDALLMITVTAIVYQVLLAPVLDVEGWGRLTDPVLHVATPAVTVVVWLVWGPHGWFDRRVVVGSLVLPLAWAAWMLARGAVIGSYPYGFANVTALGYPSVLGTLSLVLAFGLVVAAAYGGIDLLRSRQRVGVRR